jgi:hypothetical protein
MMFLYLMIVALSLEHELLDVHPILRSIAITSHLAEFDDRFRQAREQAGYKVSEVFSRIFIAVERW